MLWLWVFSRVTMCSGWTDKHLILSKPKVIQKPVNQIPSVNGGSICSRSDVGG